MLVPGLPEVLDVNLEQFMYAKKLITPHIVTTMFSALAVIMIGGNTCFGDLTFHFAETTLKRESNQKNQIDREIFPSPNGLEFFVNRSAALRIAETDIVSIIVRDAPTDSFLEDTIKLAEKRSGQKYTKLPLYEVVFRLKSSQAKKVTEFAKRNTGKTFAIRLRTLTISMPTLLGAFPEGDEFALVGVREGDIDRIRKIVPLLFKDQRSRKAQ